jgi:hypothetical protein
MIVHGVAVYCLVKDQDLHFAGDWVALSDGTQDNWELNQAKSMGKAQNVNPVSSIMDDWGCTAQHHIVIV